MVHEKKHPVTLDIDYLEKSDRLTTAFRLILIIPIFIVFAFLTTNGYNGEYVEDDENWSFFLAGIIFIPTLLMILFRHKYPKWWFNFNVEFVKFGTRVGAYFFLLRDEYPSTDEEQAVHINIPYPDAKNDLVNWMPLVKWLLAIPHVIILLFLWIGAVIGVIIAWFAILLTGSHPKGIHDFIVGVMRWTLRAEAYALLLTTDEYPPFSLK